MMKWVDLEWDGKMIRVPAQKIKGKLWFHLDGETHSLEIAVGRKKGAASGAHQNGEITAPMPGKILKVFVSRGASISKGQPVIAMEAMKMEYTLEADRDGKILELNAAVGDQVALGKLLVKIEGEQESN